MRNRVIIRRMADVKDIYKLTKFIDSEKYENTKNSISTSPVNAVNDFFNLYNATRRFKKLSNTRAALLLESAMEQGYILSVSNSSIGMMYEVSPTKGRHILAKKLYFFRVGLWDESMKHYDTTKSVIISSGIAALIATVVSSIIAHYLK
jgi:hypothetical protein